MRENNGLQAETHCLLFIYCIYYYLTLRYIVYVDVVVVEGGVRENNGLQAETHCLLWRAKLVMVNLQHKSTPHTCSD